MTALQSPNTASEALATAFHAITPSPRAALAPPSPLSPPSSDGESPPTAGCRTRRPRSAPGASCAVPGDSRALVNSARPRLSAIEVGTLAGRSKTHFSQVRAPDNASSCLTYNGEALRMEQCRPETSDTPKVGKDCTQTTCRFSSRSDQLWYLNSLGQLGSSFTKWVPPVGSPPRVAANNIPMCLRPTVPPSGTGGGSWALTLTAQVGGDDGLCYY